ncbi:hypothetical protein ACPV47_19620 [Vibrio jasicida]|uniref:hypothetical protein n=1 Tax=Vibrio jasicida TaxID=766224 RepID=UPI004068D479
MDLVAIQGAISSLKTAVDISKSFSEMKSEADIQSKVIALQTALLEAQSSALSATAAQFELQERIRELEARLEERDDWSLTRNKYSLVTPWRIPSQVYALKESESNGEPAHFICINCFSNEKKSLLNAAKDKGGFIQLVCPSCHAKADTGYRGIGSPEYAEKYVIEG